MKKNEPKKCQQHQLTKRFQVFQVFEIDAFILGIIFLISICNSSAKINKCAFFVNISFFCLAKMYKLQISGGNHDFLNIYSIIFLSREHGTHSRWISAVWGSWKRQQCIGNIIFTGLYYALFSSVF